MGYLKNGENWMTPSVSTGDYQNQSNGTKMLKLQVNYYQNWPTVKTRDYKGTNSEKGMTRKDGKSRMDQLPNAVLHHQGANNTNRRSQDKSQKMHLNPAWVCQLMGMTIEQIFYVHLVTGSVPSRQLTHLET